MADGSSWMSSDGWLIEKTMTLVSYLLVQGDESQMYAQELLIVLKWTSYKSLDMVDMVRR